MNRDGIPNAVHKDPYGKGQHEAGAKLDGGKLRADLVFNGFAHALTAVVAVGTYGANKYTDDGWVSVPDGERRYADAALRHYLARATGAATDSESGLLHLSHQAWNVLAELELFLRRVGDLDQRGGVGEHSLTVERPCHPSVWRSPGEE